MATKWTQEDMSKAIEDVKESTLSIRKAAVKHTVPRTTLRNHILGTVQSGARPGPPTVLTNEEEEEIVKWTIQMSQIGHGQTRQQVTEVVKRILDRTKRPNSFKENRPGKDWWYCFLKRYPEVKMRTPQPFQISRAISCTPLVLDRWFTEFCQLLLKYELLDKPCAIWNCDESGFPYMSRIVQNQVKCWHRNAQSRSIKLLETTKNK